MKFVRNNVQYLVAVTFLCSVAGAALFSASVYGQSGSRTQRGGTRVQQGSDSRGQNTQGRAVRSAQLPFEVRFWDWLQKVEYRNWSPMPGQGADAYEGGSPHGAYLKMYVNRAAGGNPQNMPVGSILVKENYGEDRQTLMAVTVMYRAKGYDPENGDWFYAKYEANGRPAQMNGAAIAGRVKSCTECHSGAEGNDFVFAND